MAWSKHRKARLMMCWNPQRLLYITLALGAVVVVGHLAMLAGVLFGWAPKLPVPLGSVFLLVLVVHTLRWHLLRTGWSAVCANELGSLAMHLAPGLSGEDAKTLPANVQAVLAQRVQEQGWLSWRDVMEAAQEAGLSVHRLEMAIMLGGHRSRVARRQDWKKYLDPLAWRAGRLHNLFDPLVGTSETPARARF